jgi:hypothetical protein
VPIFAHYKRQSLSNYGSEKVWIKLVQKTKKHSLHSVPFYANVSSRNHRHHHHASTILPHSLFRSQYKHPEVSVIGVLPYFCLSVDTSQYLYLCILLVLTSCSHSHSRFPIFPKTGCVLSSFKTSRRVPSRRTRSCFSILHNGRSPCRTGRTHSCVTLCS